MAVTEADLKILNFVRSEDFESIKSLIDKGAKIPTGALFSAASGGRVKILDLLLATGQFTQQDLDDALYGALESCRSAAAERLLVAGASPRCKGGLEETPVLILALRHNLLDLCKRLLKSGADPNSFSVPWAARLLGTPVGETALMVAASAGHPEIVRLLLEVGSDPWVIGAKGMTALDLVARRKGRETVAKILAEWMNKHPQTSASPPPPLKLKLSAPFTSWHDAVRQLEEATSGKGTPHPQAKSVIRFPLSLEVATVLAGKAAGGKPFDNCRNALATVQNLSVNLDASWFLQFEPGQGAFLCGLAKGDKWKVLGAFKTACANFGVTHASLLKFLKSMDAEQPFDLVECDFNSVGGRFRGMLPRPEETAQRLFEFCPFVAEDEAGSVKRLAKKLAKSGDFKIWWD